MAFADEKSLRDRSAGIGGVVIVHAGLAAVLAAGLAVKDVIPDIPDGPIDTWDIKDPPPPPPPEQPKPQPKTEAKNQPVVVPPVPSPLPSTPPLIETTIEMPSMSDTVVLTNLPDVPVGPITPALPSIEPISATPRNSASNWVTDNDYKPRWIREGLYGSASFRLEVAANGRVSDCQITRSTGHAVLDQATCSLISKRARFKPAKDSSGAKTTGSFSSTIRWQLPD